MKAILRYRYGTPSAIVVKDVAKPIPKSDEIVVKVHATTVNRTDCAMLSGIPYIYRLFIGLLKPKKPILGTDFAGEVLEIGANVTQFSVGDKVWGFNDEGIASQADFLTINTKKGVRLAPSKFSLQECVACVEGGHYAYNFINKVSIDKSSKVLLNGATGAIGIATLQILKYYGASVTAVCNTKNISLITSLGADKIIDYVKEDFTKQSEKYHYIFDTVGKSRYTLCKHLLYKNGAYISSELGKNNENLYLPITTRLFGTKKVIFPTPSKIKESLTFIKKLIESDKMKPVIDKVYTPNTIVEAYSYVSGGTKTGSVVLKLV